METFFIVIIFIIFVVFWIVGKLKKPQETWCEKCNKWSIMENKGGPISGRVCTNCGWLNQSHVGCPKCGWYGKNSDNLISRRGPFLRQQKRPVTVTWGILEEDYVFEEVRRCPKHGEFTVYIPENEINNNFPMVDVRIDSNNQIDNLHEFDDPVSVSPLENEDVPIAIDLIEYGIIIASAGFYHANFTVKQEKRRLDNDEKKALLACHNLVDNLVNQIRNSLLYEYKDIHPNDFEGKLQFIVDEYIQWLSYPEGGEILPQNENNDDARAIIFGILLNQNQILDLVCMLTCYQVVYHKKNKDGNVKSRDNLILQKTEQLGKQLIYCYVEFEKKHNSGQTSASIENKFMNIYKYQSAPYISIFTR